MAGGGGGRGTTFPTCKMLKCVPELLQIYAEYRAWAHWGDSSAQLATACLSPEDRNVIAAAYHTQLMRKGLELVAVDCVVA